MKPQTTSERSRPHLRPRFPRIALMHRRRRDDDILNPEGRRRHKVYFGPSGSVRLH